MQFVEKMIAHLFLCIFLFQAIEAQRNVGVPPPQKKWMTLNGTITLLEKDKKL